MGTAGTVAQALAFQRDGCERLGSPLYGRLLAGLEADYAGGGLTAALLDGRTSRPIHDALPLRLLGAVHRLVLEGRAPALARFYPSAGGHADGDPTPAFLAAAAAHRDEVEWLLGQGVQTNEVGRAAALAPAFALVARRTGWPLQLLEVGSSAGLLLRWDAYGYRAGGQVLGDPASALVFEDVWRGSPPDLSGPVTGPVSVEGRRGCDLAPIDATTEHGRLTLLSFVWPDQPARFDRLRLALRIAADRPVDIDRADAGAWVTAQLARPRPGRATIVFHSIVLQYLPEASRRVLREALDEAGAAATLEAPLCWLRMEPAGPVADVRLTTWPDAAAPGATRAATGGSSGHEEVLATCGYHGQDVRWGPCEPDVHPG